MHGNHGATPANALHVRDPRHVDGDDPPAHHRLEEVHGRPGMGYFDPVGGPAQMAVAGASEEEGSSTG